MTGLGGLLGSKHEHLPVCAVGSYYGIVPTAAVLWVPLLLSLASVSYLEVGLWLTAMNVQFRDVRYAVPFLVRDRMFAIPMAYPSSLLDEPWRTL